MLPESKALRQRTCITQQKFERWGRRGSPRVWDAARLQRFEYERYEFLYSAVHDSFLYVHELASHCVASESLLEVSAC